MATWKFEGNDQYIAYLRKLDVNADEMIRKAVYKGAGYVADNVKSALNGLTTDDSRKKEEMRSGPTTLQKEGLIKGFGLSKMKDENGYINVKLGFSGRNRLKSKRNPQGQANIVVARNVESGTSWMRKQPSIRKAVNRSKKQCEEIMKETFDREISKIN